MYVQGGKCLWWYLLVITSYGLGCSLVFDVWRRCVAGVVVVALLLAVREVEFRTAFIPGGRIMTEWGCLRGK